MSCGRYVTNEIKSEWWSLNVPAQNNCWFFVSLLQKHLSGVGRGVFTFGRLRSQNLDPATRESIDAEVKVGSDLTLSINICIVSLSNRIASPQRK